MLDSYISKHVNKELRVTVVDLHGNVLFDSSQNDSHELDNRILIPMMNEAMGIVADGIASPADVDVAMQLGAGMKSGPLHTADLVGHDVNLAIMETLYHETGDPKYRPHPLMRQMVRAGWLGVKTGKGFFEYDGPFGKEIVK